MKRCRASIDMKLLIAMKRIHTVFGCDNHFSSVIEIMIEIIEKETTCKHARNRNRVEFT